MWHFKEESRSWLARSQLIPMKSAELPHGTHGRYKFAPMPSSLELEVHVLSLFTEITISKCNSNVCYICWTNKALSKAAPSYLWFYTDFWYFQPLYLCLHSLSLPRPLQVQEQVMLTELPLPWANVAAATANCKQRWHELSSHLLRWGFVPCLM